MCFRLIAQTPIPEVEGKPTGKPEKKPIHWTNRSSESLSEPAGKLVKGEERDHDSKLSLVPYDPRVESQSRANLIWRYYSFRMNWYLCNPLNRGVKKSEHKPHILAVMSCEKGVVHLRICMKTTWQIQFFFGFFSHWVFGKTPWFVFLDSPSLSSIEVILC